MLAWLKLLLQCGPRCCNWQGEKVILLEGTKYLPSGLGSGTNFLCGLGQLSQKCCASVPQSVKPG